MNCQNCKKDIPLDNKFCKFCGVKIIKKTVSLKTVLFLLSVLFITSFLFGGAYFYQKNKIADCVLKNIGKPPTVHSSDNDSKWKTVNGRISQEQLLDNYNTELKQQSEFCADLYKMF